MRRSIPRHRKAIAMIELIFAIVVMGIVMLSIPNLIRVSSESGYTSLQQEAIASAASQMSLIITKHWDEQNTISGIGSILSTNTSNIYLRERNGTDQRSRFSSGTEYPSSSAFADINDTFDDMDDADGSTMTLRNFSNTNLSSGDTLDTTITIDTNVRYINDNTSGGNDYDATTIQFNFDPSSGVVTGTRNIKLITNTLTNNSITELSKTISLHSFSCNIGTYPSGQTDL